MSVGEPQMKLTGSEITSIYINYTVLFRGNKCFCCSYEILMYFIRLLLLLFLLLLLLLLLFFCCFM